MKERIVEILLVDDSEDDILMIEEAFENANLLNILQVVKDGEEAMAYLRQEGKYADAEMPGLILLDINMPKKNGFEVLEEIKADPNLKQTPVVMLTTSDRETDIVKSYSAGASSYITKPVGFDNLKKVIEQLGLYWAVVSKIPNPSGKKS